MTEWKVVTYDAGPFLAQTFVVEETARQHFNFYRKMRGFCELEKWVDGKMVSLEGTYGEPYHHFSFFGLVVR